MPVLRTGLVPHRLPHGCVHRHFSILGSIGYIFTCRDRRRWSQRTYSEKTVRQVESEVLTARILMRNSTEINNVTPSLLTG